MSKKDYVYCEATMVVEKDASGKETKVIRYDPVDSSKIGLRGKISAWCVDHPVAAKVIKVGGLAALTGGASLLGWWARGKDCEASEPLALAAGTTEASTDNNNPSETTHSEGEV